MNDNEKQKKNRDWEEVRRSAQEYMEENPEIFLAKEAMKRTGRIQSKIVADLLNPSHYSPQPK